MTRTVATKSDLSSVTRYLASHPTYTYTTRAGEFGTIVFMINEGR